VPNGVIIVARRSKFRTALLLFTVATVAYSIKSNKSHGRFLGVPFDWRATSLGAVARKLWNPSDARLFTPTIFGIGWVPNAHQLLQRLGSLGAGPHYKQVLEDPDLDSNPDADADANAHAHEDEGEGDDEERLT
jgi:hypothetical protein